MTETKQVIEGQVVPEDADAAVRAAMQAFVEAIYANQGKSGMWTGTNRRTDYTKFFAELHSSVTRAYETYDEGGGSMDVIWANPVMGNEVPPGAGMPQGLPATLGEIVIAIVGFMRHLGVDAGSFLCDMVKGEAAFMAADGDSQIAGEGMEEEEEFDEGDEADAEEEMPATGK